MENSGRPVWTPEVHQGLLHPAHKQSEQACSYATRSTPTFIVVLIGDIFAWIVQHKDQLLLWVSAAQNYPLSLISSIRW